MEDILDKVKESYRFIQEKLKGKIDVSIILGSGLGELAEEIKDPVRIEYRDIPNFPVSTVPGHAGRLVIGKIGDTSVMAMQGRFHFYEGYSMSQVTFPVRVMSMLGVKAVVLTNAAGGINLDFVPGDLMVIKDHINLTMNNPLIGKNIDELGPRFPDMSETYSKRLIENLKTIYEKHGIRFVSGVYAGLTGPSFETPAEIRMLRILGADAVGMSTIPEAIAARHCGMEVCGISCITNMAAGILDQPLTHEEVIETSNMVKEKFKAVLRDLIRDIQIR